MNDVDSVVVLRALAGIGDMLCAVPALRSLRAGLPRARVTLIGLPWASAFVERFPAYVDELVVFPGFPGIPEVPAAVESLPAFLERMQARRFDLALQMQGSGFASNPFTVLLGARETAGFYLPGQYKPSEACIAYPGHLHELQRMQALPLALGMPDTGEDLEWPVTAADRDELAGASRELLAPGAYAVVHAGANQPERRWPAERFAVVADRLADAGLRVVLTGGPGYRELTAALARAMHAPVLDLAGRTSLGALGALVAGARLLLGNDTGVSHIAAALKTPSVVVFSAADPRRWAPLDRELNVPVHPTLALGGAEAERDVNDHCLRDGCRHLTAELAAAPFVEVDQVLDAVEHQLAKEGERVA
jgi:ADP-heptose:LPS heptosyltransferase